MGDGDLERRQRAEAEIARRSRVMAGDHTDDGPSPEREERPRPGPGGGAVGSGSAAG